jgi:hypothetical protein
VVLDSVKSILSRGWVVLVIVILIRWRWPSDHLSR